MKKILLFSVFLSLIIGIFHHPIIFFANSEINHHSHIDIENNIQSSPENHEHNKIDHKSGDYHFYIIRNNIDQNNSKIKKIYKFSYLELDINNYFLLNRNNLVNKTSPPILNKKIKFYSYTDLVKIIKSNT